MQDYRDAGWPVNGCKRGDDSHGRLGSPAIRLRDFLAGPARTTVHSIEILLQRYRITASVGGHSTAIRARLGGRGQLGRNQPRRQIDPERLTHQLRARPMLRFHGPLDLLRHRRRKRNGKRRTLSHGCYFVILSMSMLAHSPHTVILSGAATSRSEVAAGSNDPTLNRGSGVLRYSRDAREQPLSAKAASTTRPAQERRYQSPFR